jgi:hypothetical protein
MKALYTTWIWAMTGGGPFMWTVGFYGLGGQHVTAEASLSKFVGAWGDPRHAKATVLAANYTGGPLSGMSQNWGIDGAPIRYLSYCNYMHFALEVQRAYAWMTGKIYVH